MSGGFFSNGNRRLTKLVLSKLAWGSIVIVMVQVQGYLPNLDFLSPKTLKTLAFCIAVFLSASKGVEMFFDQTIQLFRSKEISFDTEPLPKPPPNPGGTERTP